VTARALQLGFCHAIILLMPITCKVFPPKSVILDVLKNRNVRIVWEKPRVLHYCGASKRELRKLIKKEKPDLVLNHSFPSFDLPVFQVYHPIKEIGDWIKNKKVLTNCLPVAKVYYRILGIQVQFQEVNFPSKKRIKFKFKFNLLSLWQSFKRFMYWQ